VVKHEVVIIGGGPAGSTCARALQKSGVDVLLLDKQYFPRDKTCAGWVTPQVCQTLHLDLDEYRSERTLQPITGFRTGVIGGKEIETLYDSIVSYGIRRCEFDHYLLCNSGARTRLGEPLKTMERKNKGWILNGEYEASLLIGAGGHFCPVARTLGNRKTCGNPVVKAQEVEFYVDDEELQAGTIDAEKPELFFCKDLEGYGWCFRKGNYLNIGLGRIDSVNLNQHVQSFCAFLKDRKKVVCEIPDKFHGHAYQLYDQHEPKLIGDHVLLIGDSAGMAYPHSGEGIRPAVESAVLAAEVIVNCQGDYSQECLNHYRQQIFNRFGVPQSSGVIGYIPESWLCSLATRLLSNHWFSRHVVLDRWFLHADQPVLFH